MALHRQLNSRELLFQGGSNLQVVAQADSYIEESGDTIQYGFVLHMVHVAGTFMIEQGTDGLLRGFFLEGVLTGKDMLAYVDLSRLAVERYPKILDYIQ